MTGKEALKQLKERIMTRYDDIRFGAIEEDLNKLEKLKKVLEIIKRKDICPTKLYGARDYRTYLWVCEQEQIDKEWILTEKEYILLNKVFFE